MKSYIQTMFYLIILIFAFSKADVKARIIYKQNFEGKDTFLRDFWQDKSNEKFINKNCFAGNSCWKIIIRNENKNRLKVCRAIEQFKLHLTDKDSFRITFYIKNDMMPHKGNTKSIIGLIGLFRSKAKSAWGANSPFVGIGLSFDKRSHSPRFSLHIRPTDAPWYDYYSGKPKNLKFGKWHKIQIEYLGEIRKFTYKIIAPKTNKILYKETYVLPVYGRGYSREFNVDAFGFCDVRAIDGRDIGICIDNVTIEKLSTSTEFEI